MVPTKKGERIKLNIGNFLRRHHLLKADGRKECFDAIEQQYKNLIHLMEANQESARSAFLDIKAKPKIYRLTWPVVARVVLIKLGQDLRTGNGDEKDVGDRLLRVINKLLLPPTKKLLYNIVDGIAFSRGILETESITDKLSGLIQEMEQLEEIEQETVSMDLEEIKEENADLRAALFGLKQELTDLQIKINDMQEAAKTQAIVSFLSEMNAPSSGYLLDNIIQSSHVISDLLNRGWTPEPPEVEGVLYSLKMITDHLQKIGLTPIRSIGEQAKITMEDLTYVNYIGSEFQGHKQAKWVVFRTSGWSYKDQLISRPQSIEVDNKIITEGE